MLRHVPCHPPAPATKALLQWSPWALLFMCLDWQVASKPSDTYEESLDRQPFNWSVTGKHTCKYHLSSSAIRQTTNAPAAASARIYYIPSSKTAPTRAFICPYISLSVRLPTRQMPTRAQQASSHMPRMLISACCGF